MRLTIIHDIQGNITSVAASPTGSPTAYMRLAPGQRAIEVEAKELTPDSDPKYIREFLADIVGNHQVAITTAEGKLTKRASLAA